MLSRYTHINHYKRYLREQGISYQVIKHEDITIITFFDCAQMEAFFDMNGKYISEGAA